MIDVHLGGSPTQELKILARDLDLLPRILRPLTVKVTYVSDRPGPVFSMSVNGTVSDGDQVARSPQRFLSTVPKTVSITVPRSTDYGYLYAKNTCLVITQDTANKAMTEANCYYHIEYLCAYKFENTRVVPTMSQTAKALGSLGASGPSEGVG